MLSVSTHNINSQLFILLQRGTPKHASIQKSVRNDTFCDAFVGTVKLDLQFTDGAWIYWIYGQGVNAAMRSSIL